MFLIDTLTDKPIIISEVAEALTQLYTDGDIRDLITELFRNTEIKPAEFMDYNDTLEHLNTYTGWTEDLEGVSTKDIVTLIDTNEVDEDLLMYHVVHTSRTLCPLKLRDSLNYYIADGGL